MEDIPALGPAQSKYLFHFTGRPGKQSGQVVPRQIRRMKPPERLDGILGSGMSVFPPWGTSQPCICFSESPPKHLAYLINGRGFAPWGLVFRREAVLEAGGGAVAYVPKAVHSRLKQAGLEHWAVHTGTGSEWTHEREWRLPFQQGMYLPEVKAILIGDPAWRPTPIDGSAPWLWRNLAIWVWDDGKRKVKKHKAGTLG